MKRIISLILTVILFCTSLPVAAYADAIVFRNDFTIVRGPASEEEKEFRQWASKLVDEYRYFYSYIYKDTAEYATKDTEVINIYKEPLSGLLVPKHETTEMEMAWFMPYYHLAWQKRLFDGSVWAEQKNAFGFVTRSVAYDASDMMSDPEKRQEMYTWLLTEVLKEKVEADPGILEETNFISRMTEGYYRYDLSSGKMVYDPSLKIVQTQSRKDMEADVLTAVVDALDYAVKGWIEGQHLLDKASSITARAKISAKQEPDYNKVFNDLKKDLENTLVDTIEKLIKTEIDELHTNINKKLTNELHERLAVQLANAYINGNRNIVGYLKSTYLEDTSDAVALYQSLTVGETSDFDARTEFIQAVNRMIEKLDSPEMIDLAEREARDVLASYTLDEVLGTEEIISNEAIIYHVATATLIELLSGVAEDLVNFFSAALSETLKPYTKQANELAIVTETIQEYFIKDLGGELLSRCVKGMKNNIERYDPSKDNAEEGNISVWWNTCLKEIEEELDWDQFTEYAQHKAIERGMELIKNLLMDTPDEKDPKGLEKAFKAVTDSSKEPNGRSGDIELWKILVGLVMCSFRELFVPYQKSLEIKMKFMQEKDLELLKNRLKAMDSTAKKLAEKPDDKDCWWDFSVAFMDFMVFIGDMERDYKVHSPISIVSEEYIIALRYVWFVRTGEGDSPDFTYYRNANTDTEFLGAFFRNTGFWKMLIKSILLNADDPEKMLTDVYKAEDYAKSNLFDLSDEKIRLFNIRQTKTEEKIKKGPGILVVVDTIFTLIDKLWGQAKTTGGSFWTAINSLLDWIHKEDMASLMAQRINIVAANSELLSLQLRYLTMGQIRTSAYRNNDIALIQAMDNRSGTVTYSYKSMNAEEILNPQLTPDLNSIKALTNDILTQINLDAVGMGAYYTMIRNVMQYCNSNFFIQYVNTAGILLPEKEANNRLQTIVKFFKDYDSSYKHEWDVLFE